MNDQDFQAKLAELLEQIEQLPADQRPKLEELAEETRRRHQRMRQTLSELQESLDYLRLSVKYLVFDLEATRRENRYLRSLLSKEDGQEE
ncbi:MAG: transcriptional regulator [Leptolyngbya sp. PLA3]|nr:MAG: transcriptional regulator [Cyanobacteria bacterium CYA]MCE7967315.1 transcriptional regulator [Leptolyngbya sp. PL-A3]